MAFDQTTRNRLQKFVSDARALLSEEFIRQMQNDFGLDPDSGEVSSLDKLTHLNDSQRETAQLLRDTMEHYMASGSVDASAALDRIVREQAFTVLNRLCALRMAEARGILIESVGNGYTSKGFQLYAHLAGTGLGETGDSYRCYLFSIFDEFSQDLAVLFDRYSPMGRLFPRDSVLLELLAHINHIDIAPLWAEDESIGWIYQYFNSKEERKKMRDESSAPRNSRELAVRNQFFTPRYVVEFLTDNTLGRIWYEMTQGQTGLKESCKYLVRRPNEIFLQPGEKIQEDDEPSEDLSQEELLKQPVYIPFRHLKDPREIRMLDPACGSMHFGLYAFDLFYTIYEEAWEMEENGQWPLAENASDSHTLHDSYECQKELLQDIPRLIIEHNIHGVDIDPRAVQIAGLSLWLRAQRNWQDQGVKLIDRPQVRRSNIVCAEPMPGEKDLLQDFANSLKPNVLGQLVKIIFEKMELAGEAGSLLKIEEEIVDAIEEAREEFNRELLRRKKSEGFLPGMAPDKQQTSLFDFADLPDKTKFWQTAEQQILDALQDYAEHAEGSESTRRRLFADDAAKGFAFIDLCRKRFDVVLMNPPYGTGAKDTKSILSTHYPSSWIEVYICFCERAIQLCQMGIIGALTSRTWMYLQKFIVFRKMVLQKSLCSCLIDLGPGVLDTATVETAAWIFHSNIQKKQAITFFSVEKDTEKADSTIKKIKQIVSGILDKDSFIRLSKDFIDKGNCSVSYKASIDQSLFRIAGENYYQAKPGLGTRDDFRFARLRWEVPPPGLLNGKWACAVFGGQQNQFYADQIMVVNWAHNGKEMKSFIAARYGSASRSIINTNLYFKSGITYQYTGSVFKAHVLHDGAIITMAGQGLYPKNNDDIFPLLGVLNSSNATKALKEINPGRFFQASYVNALRLHNDWKSQKGLFGRKAIEAFEVQRELNSYNETSPLFHFGNVSVDHIKNRTQIESLRNMLLLTVNDLNSLTKSCFPKDGNGAVNEEKETVKKVSLAEEISEKVSYFLGCVLGRWDIQYATGRKKILNFPEPFASLPVCPLGLLQNDIGLPAAPQDVPVDYPIRVTWSGILVDDEGHSDDIITRLREAFEVVWHDHGRDLEQEACVTFKVKSLRDYFRKQAKFFGNHLKIYSKNRRQSPIYWPISTVSGSYTLWLYYHRFTDQTLYTCVNDFVEPKIEQVSSQLSDLQTKTSRSKQEEKEFEILTNLELELKDFRDELLRIAKFWKPNLNDGVQITAAPLWNLFRLAKWNKKLKTTWQKLEKGDYDWAHLAYSIWPDRVIPKAHKDRSLAIAHNLEGELWDEVENGTDRQGNPKYKWEPKKLSKADIDELIALKTDR